MKYSHIIWDFNGTILDDATTGFEIINTLLKRRAKPPVDSIDEYREAFCFPIAEYYRKLGFTFTEADYDEMAQEWVALYLESVKKARLRRGVIETVRTLKASGHYQIVLSATEEGMLAEQIAGLGIGGYFDEILGLDNFYAHGKAELGRLWAQKTQPKKALLIGDTAHDYEVAKAMGADCLLVSGGHQSLPTLMACGAPVLESIPDVLDYILV